MTFALQRAREMLSAQVDRRGWRGDAVRVSVGPLSARQAIGDPARKDYALQRGKEAMVEACFQGRFGQAFTGHPRDFRGILDDVFRLDLEDNGGRAIFVAVINAVGSALGLAGRTRHCRNEEPEECARRIAAEILLRRGRTRICQIGYQPALLENLVRSFGAGRVTCHDLDPANIGAVRFGVAIGDGATAPLEAISACDLVLATGSVLTNGTFDGIEQAARATGKDLALFGVTGAAVSALLGLERICPMGHETD